MKKLILCIFCLLIFAGSCAVANAEVPVCAVADMQALFERYASFTINEDGIWTARNTDAVRMLAGAEAGSVKASMNNGAALLIPSVRGDAERSYAEVVLHVYVFRHSPVNVRGISIVTGGVRYDIVTGAAAETAGAYACERMDIPLCEQGFEMLKSISDNGCSLYVYGSGKHFTAEITADAELAAVRSLLAELPEAYIEGYDLWDENAARWNDDRKQIQPVPTGGDGKYDAVLIAPFDVMDISVRDNVMLLQGMLTENGFYVGQQDGKYGDGTENAVIAAQRYYDLTQTGIPDRRLLGCLSGEDIASEAPEAVDNGLADCGIMRISINGYWFANRVTPVAGMQTGNDVSPMSRGNTLLVTCGTIVNTDIEELQLPIVMDARLVLDGKYTYPCTICCEKSGMPYYGTSLIPLEEARLVIYTEVPAAAMEITDKALIIAMYADTEETALEYSLK